MVECCMRRARMCRYMRSGVHFGRPSYKLINGHAAGIESLHRTANQRAEAVLGDARCRRCRCEVDMCEC